MQKCFTLTLSVNTKNISLAYLLANYLKFNAPSSIFHSSTKYLLQKELMGCKKNSIQKFHERKKKIFMSLSFLPKFQVQS